MLVDKKKSDYSGKTGGCPYGSCYCPRLSLSARWLDALCRSAMLESSMYAGFSQVGFSDRLFVMATITLASDADVLMGFQGNGVMLTLKGMADHVAVSGFPPLKNLGRLAPFRAKSGSPSTFVPPSP